MAVESPVAKLVRQLQEQHTSVAQYMQVVAESPALAFARQIHEQVNRFSFQNFGSVTMDIQKLFGSTFIASALALQAHSATLIPAVENDLYGYLEDEDNAAEVLTKFYHVLRCITNYLIKRVKNHKLSITEVLSITLSVLFWLDGNSDNAKTRELVKAELAKTEKRIGCQITTTKSKEATSNSSVVVHETSVRVSPSHKSAKVTTVYKNQLVSVLLRQKEWAYVQYFDHIDGIPKTGWVAKKYMTNIKEL
jgi:hypothetical protein